MLVFLIGLVLGTVLFLSAASSSVEKYRRIFENLQFKDGPPKYNLLEEQYDPAGEILRTAECSLGNFKCFALSSSYYNDLLNLRLRKSKQAPTRSLLRH